MGCGNGGPTDAGASPRTSDAASLSSATGVPTTPNQVEEEVTADGVEAALGNQPYLGGFKVAAPHADTFAMRAGAAKSFYSACGFNEALLGSAELPGVEYELAGSPAGGITLAYPTTAEAEAARARFLSAAGTGCDGQQVLSSGLSFALIGLQDEPKVARHLIIGHANTVTWLYGFREVDAEATARSVKAALTLP